MVKSKSVLLTGAAGFLGVSVAHSLSQSGWAVAGADRLSAPPGVEFFKYYQCDLTATNPLQDVLRETRPDYLIHFAGSADVGRSVREPLNDFLLGPSVFAKVLEDVRVISPQTKMILASSAAVYGQPEKLPVIEESTIRPLSPYGYHKWMSELLAREYYQVYGLSVAIIRIFSAYGEGLKKQILWDICQKCQKGKVMLGGDGDETRDFIHSDDIGQAIRLIGEKSSFDAQIYNLASGNETSVRKVAEMVLEKSGVSSSCLDFTKESRAGDPRNWRADITKLTNFGYKQSVTLDAGISRYVNWFKNEARL